MNESDNAWYRLSRRTLLIASAGLAVTSACAAPALNAQSPSTGANRMATTPTIILVHGFWGGAAHWSKVIVHLSRMGYTSIHAVENPLTSLADDVERTRKMVAQHKGPVLLVGHSYGGMVITGAGTAPNVVGLVYIAAWVPDAGESLGALASVGTPPPGGGDAFVDSDGHLWIEPSKFRE